MPAFEFMLANYRLVGRLGQGGMGVVYRGEDVVLRRPVALKFMTLEGSDLERQRARFLREARTAASLNHPNICTIYHVGQVEAGVHVRPDPDGPTIAEGTAYIAMELIEGTTLADLLADSGPLPMDRLLSSLQQVAEGLAEAHKHGIVHRDLKLANLMLTDAGRVKVLDFGLARPGSAVKIDAEATTVLRTATELTRPGTVLGTIHYMSPEQIQGLPVGPPSDVFSFGILAQELATGRRPFCADSAPATMAKILEAEPDALEELRPDVPSELGQIVRDCLRKPIDQRPAAAAVARCLREIRRAMVSGTNLEASGSTAADGTTLPARGLRRPLWVALAAAAVLVAVLFAARAGLLSPTSPPINPSSVVVLPMTNLSDDPEDTDYLGDGIVQAVIQRLSDAGHRVTPWETARRFRGSPRSADEIAAEVGSNATLMGEFALQDDGELWTRLSFVDVVSGLKSWSQEFSGSADQLFDLQAQIAVKVSSGLSDQGVELDPDALSVAEATNAEAYELYLQGVHLLQQGDQEAVQIAFGYFQRASRLDEEFEDPHIGMGAVQATRYFFGWGGEQELLDAERHFSDALRIDPRSMRARSGLIRVEYERGLAERCLAQAGEARRFGREDDVDTLMAVGLGYTLGGLPERGEPYFMRMLDLDPANVAAARFLIVARAWATEYEAAIEAGLRFLDRYETLVAPDTLAEAHVWVAVSHHALGHGQLAAPHYDEALRLFGEGSNIYVGVFAGVLYERLERPERAAEIWRGSLEHTNEVLGAHPANTRMLLQRLALLRLLDEDELASEAEAAWEAAPYKPSPATYVMVLAHLMRGDAERAVRYIRVTTSNGGFQSLLPMLVDLTGLSRAQDPLLKAALEEWEVERSRLDSLY